MESLGAQKPIASLDRPASMESWNDLLQFAHSQTDSAVNDEKKAFGMKLAIEELLSNIIRANSERVDGGPDKEVNIEIASFSSPEGVKPSFILRTIDTGLYFDPRFEGITREIADVPIDQRRIGGLGLFLVKSSVDEAHYSYADGRNTYHLITDIGANHEQ